MERPGRRSYWRKVRQMKVFKDLPDHRGLGDECHDPQAATTVIASKDIDRVGALLEEPPSRDGGSGEPVKTAAAPSPVVKAGLMPVPRSRPRPPRRRRPTCPCRSRWAQRCRGIAPYAFAAAG